MPKRSCAVCKAVLEMAQFKIMTASLLLAGLTFRGIKDVEVKQGNNYYVCDTDYVLFNIAGLSTSVPPFEVEKCCICDDWCGPGIGPDRWTVSFKTNEWCHKACLLTRRKN